MAYTPSGTIAFYRVPWKSDYKDVRLFTSKTEESNYFSSPLRVEQNYTYIRDKQAIKVNANKEAMEQYNYIRYMNENFSLKWFYAFITGVEYINQNACYVYFEQDVYTTWWDCFNIKSAFVEREHTNNDSDAYNTETENISISKYVQDYIGYSKDYSCNNYVDTAGTISGYALVAVTTSLPVIRLNTTSPSATHENLNEFEFAFKHNKSRAPVIFGAPSEFTYAVFKTKKEFDYFLDVITIAGQVDSIVSVFAIRQEILDSIATYKHIEATTENLMNDGLGLVIFFRTSGSEQTEIGLSRYVPKIITNIAESEVLGNSFGIFNIAGYEPKNRKMYHYPFCKWVIDANNGDYTELLPELLSSSTGVTIYQKLSFDIECKCKAIPQRYAVASTIGASVGFELFPIEHSVELNCSVNYPILKDNALVWAALNRNTAATQISNAKIKMSNDVAYGVLDTAASAVTSIASAAIGGNPAGSVLSLKQGVSEYTDMLRAVERDKAQIREIEANIADKTSLPSDTKNLSYNDTWQHQNGMAKFAVRHMCPPLSEVKKYDDYLSKYGYATNMFKTPNLTGRTNWNYVKTTEITIAPVAQNSYAPTDTELRFIEDIFNKGVTFWHINDVGNYGDYTNEIITVEPDKPV